MQLKAFTGITFVSAASIAVSCTPANSQPAPQAPDSPPPAAAAPAPVDTPVAPPPPLAAEAPSPAAEIDGYRWEFPCKEPMREEILSPTENVDCSSTHVTGDPNTTDNFTTTKTFGGEAGKTYDVTLRFRGVVEPMTYKDGVKDGDYFYIGGAPLDEHYNVYKIEVSAPKAYYYLNRQDEVGHKIFTIDYTKTIKVEGGASITLSGDGQNGLMISNFKKLTIPEVAPEPYNGQFIQVDVVSVAEAN